MLKFGIFDHLDHNGAPLGTLLEDRLKLVALIEQEGYYAYHLAEHHATPLGSVPSPSVFLAAAIQRTRTIRIGPLVYVLPLYHPLRLFEEICMLDHMSSGRLQLGVGRGGALLEHQRYGLAPEHAQAMYHEAFAVLMRAFESDVIDFEGQFFRYKDFVVQAKPVQRPHPPLWYGAPNAEAIAWAAPRAINVVSLGPAQRAREISERYREIWAGLGRNAAELPMIGVTRHVVVAESDTAAKHLARRSYRRWRESMEFIWARTGAEFPLAAIYPQDFTALEAIGHGIAGSPATVRRSIEELQRETGINYLLCQTTFGDMKLPETANSIRLLAREVMPAFA